VVAVAGEDHDAYLVVGVGEIERRVELVDHQGVLGVGHLGSIEGDGAHRAVDRVGDRGEVGHVPSLAGTGPEGETR
jgi:hypothetical protein